MQDPLKQAVAVEDADVQKQFTQVLLLEELMELNVNTCNLECKDPNLVVPNEDYRISIPVLQGDHLDIKSEKSLFEQDYGKDQEVDQETFPSSRGNSTDRTKSDKTIENPHWVFDCRISLIASIIVFSVLFILFGLLQARQYKEIKKFQNATRIKM